MTPEEWSRIEAISHDALERPNAERAVFLDSACGGIQSCASTLHLYRSVRRIGDAALVRCKTQEEFSRVARTRQG
jgi:hypothetical protein